MSKLQLILYCIRALKHIGIKACNNVLKFDKLWCKIIFNMTNGLQCSTKALIPWRGALQARRFVFFGAGSS